MNKCKIVRMYDTTGLCVADTCVPSNCSFFCKICDKAIVKAFGTCQSIVIRNRKKAMKEYYQGNLKGDR